jgi:hypothetical protein
LAALLVSLLAIAGFALLLARLSVVAAGRRMITAVMGGLGTMLDREMDDDAKELAVRRAGVLLLGETGRLGLLIAAALGAAVLPIAVADILALADAGTVFALMLRVDYLLAVSAAAILLVWLAGRFRRQAGAPQATGLGGEAYGFGDRLFHMLAFAGPGVQKAMARLDELLYGSQIDKVPETPPVFITSLARGGTTAVLNALQGRDGLATHVYRDMPFLTAPLVWSKLTGKDRQVARRARAHGDGLEIDLDSPEAFDEVFWMLFWPEHYRPDRVAPWTEADVRPIARSFMLRQFARIRMLRCGPRATTARYLSKNNANIARIRLLPQLFPGCAIVVPLRRPGAHAASLLRQHRNFLKRHAEDEFTRRYMRDIGHLEFGALHRPLAFPGFEPAQFDPLTGDYWLAYWLAAFRDVLACADAITLVTQDDLRARPQPVMQALAARLGLKAEGIDFAGHFRAGPDETPAGLFSPALLAEAEALYNQLAARALR